MEPRKGTAATRAKNKYNAANYDRLSPFVRKGKRTGIGPQQMLGDIALMSSWKPPWTAWRTKSWEKSSGATRAGVARMNSRPAGIIIFLCSDYYHGF